MVIKISQDNMHLQDNNKHNKGRNWFVILLKALGYK